MPAEARVTSIWKKQKLFVACFLLAVGAWFCWDGAVGYPRSNTRFAAHEALKKEDRLAEWAALAASRGWTAEVPHKFFKPEDIFMQFACGTLGALLGGITLAYWFVQKDRVLKSDADAVFTPAGTRVPFSAITGLGKKKWESKGLATVRYALAGRKGQFVIDDYKFDRDPTHAILGEIESALEGGAVSSEQ